MCEEYLIARLVYDLQIPYNFAQWIIMDLDKKNLLNHLKLNIEKYEDFNDILTIYYKNINSEVIYEL